MINLKNLTPNSLVSLSIKKLDDILIYIDKRISNRTYETGISNMYKGCMYISIDDIDFDKINNVEIDILKEYFKYLGWDFVKIDANETFFKLNLYKNEKDLNKMISENVSNSSNKDIEFLSLEDFVKTQMKK